MESGENYLKYLRGEPLNEELAKVRAGHYADSELLQIAQQIDEDPVLAIENPEKPLTRDERVALKEIRIAPGWPVLIKVMERLLVAQRRIATSLSEADYKVTGEELASAWLPVQIWKKLIVQMNYAVVMEIEPLEGTHEVTAAIGRP